MKLTSVFRLRGAMAAVSALALSAGVFIYHAKADGWDKKTVLTISDTIQVRDTVLNPGQYVFKLLDSQSDRHVVQIFNADQTHLYGTILAIPKERMEPADKTEFTFWETPPGTARAMRSWYYPGDLWGQEFPYPKHLKEVAMVTTTTAETPAAIAPVPATEPVPETVAPVTVQPETQPQAETPAPVQQPTEMAAVTPQQDTATPAPAATEPAPAPAELPKTASPYPLIGLSGLVLLGLSGLMKLKRTA